VIAADRNFGGRRLEVVGMLEDGDVLRLECRTFRESSPEDRSRTPRIGTRSLSQHP
jgi:hypothetical protein